MKPPQSPPLALRPLSYRVGYVLGWVLVWAFLLALTVGPAVLVWTMGGVE